MDKIVNLISQIITPGKTWGYFFRKTLSTILVASIGAYAFNTYRSYTSSHWEKLPLHTAIKTNTIEVEVKRYLQLLIAADISLVSVWIYSWPDARSLIPVSSAGHQVNPLPLGYFVVTDAPAIGKLVMDQCACIDRPNKKLLACPIHTENDAWGIIVFQHRHDKKQPTGYKATYVALTHKITDLIYNN